jgi:hypothetical protein
LSLSADALYYLEELDRLADAMPPGGIALPAGAPESAPFQEVLFLLRESLLGAASNGPTNPTPAFLTDEEVEQLPPVQFLVEGLIPEGATAEVHGPPGSGKSFFALAIACCVTRGLGFCGHPVRRGPVVYVVGEGLAGIGARLRAWKAEHGSGGSVGLYFRNGPVQLLDRADVTRFIARVKGLPAPPALIVIDTLARCMVGGDENSAKDMGLAIAAIDHIRTETGAAILIVHHTGKSGELERGSTALRGAVDAMMLIQNDGGRITISSEKEKDASPFAPMTLRLKPVADSCTLSLSDSEADFGAVAIKPLHDQALRSLSRDFLEDGATSTQWLKASQIKEASFYRAVTELVRWGYVAKPEQQRGGRYTLTEDGKARVTINYHEAISSLSEPEHPSLSTLRPPLKGEGCDSDSERDSQIDVLEVA